MGPDTARASSVARAVSGAMSPKMDMIPSSELASTPGMAFAIFELKEDEISSEDSTRSEYGPDVFAILNWLVFVNYCRSLELPACTADNLFECNKSLGFVRLSL